MFIFNNNYSREIGQYSFLNEEMASRLLERIYKRE